MYCEKCGKEIENNSKFCIHCGEKVRKSLRTDNVTGYGGNVANTETRETKAVINPHKYVSVVFGVIGIILCVMVLYRFWEIHDRATEALVDFCEDWYGVSPASYLRMYWGVLAWGVVCGITVIIASLLKNKTLDWLAILSAISLIIVFIWVRMVYQDLDGSREEYESVRSMIKCMIAELYTSAFSMKYYFLMGGCAISIYLKKKIGGY